MWVVYTASGAPILFCFLFVTMMIFCFFTSIIDGCMIIPPLIGRCPSTRVCAPKLPNDNIYLFLHLRYSNRVFCRMNVACCWTRVLVMFLPTINFFFLYIAFCFCFFKIVRFSYQCLAYSYSKHYYVLVRMRSLRFLAWYTHTEEFFLQQQANVIIIRFTT